MQIVTSSIYLNKFVESKKVLMVEKDKELRGQEHKEVKSRMKT